MSGATTENSDIFKDSEVAKFYNGKSVFITGGTGFIGKATIEKLLYGCAGIENIYVFVREKKGIPPEKRISEITEGPAFDRVRAHRPNDLQKLIPIMGDLKMKNLGMSAADLKTLSQKVNVVIHLAATVNFNDPLKDAIRLNINAVEELFVICKQWRKLEAFVHCSTAYSHTDKNATEEIVYSEPGDLEHYRYMAEHYSDDEVIVKKLLGKRPNSYTLTKAFAENVVVKTHGDIPTVIVRPSVVICSNEEPVPGWLEGWHGLTGVCLATSAGLLRVAKGKENNIAELIPVDIVVNFLVVVATKIDKKSKDVKVYNLSTGQSNPITWKEACDNVIQVSLQNNLAIIPYPFVYYTQYLWLFALLVFLFQTLPSFLIDLYYRLIGKKPQLMKLQEKITKNAASIEIFGMYNWNITDSNVRKLLEEISPLDRKLFNFDVKNVDKYKMARNMVYGSYKYVLKKPIEKKIEEK